MKMPPSLDSLFRPSRVAVIGASTDPRNLGTRIVRNLYAGGFPGAIFPVHPAGGEIDDLPVYDSIESLPDGIALAVVCVPRQAVLAVVDQCSRKKVRFIVIVSAGFAETDMDGVTLQRLLADKAHQDGLRIIGPNCVGIINTDPTVRLNTTFCPLTLTSGPVALCSQSGALGVLALAKGDLFKIGYSQFVSVGNEVDLSTAELVEHWGNDDQTGVILLYLESIKNASHFRQAALRVSRQKPIVAIKAGREEPGNRAARSHTAALASSQLAVDAFFRQTGVISTDGLDEMLDLAAMLSHQPLPDGARVGIVTNAGGPAVLCADECARIGLRVPILSCELQNRLAEYTALPASVGNPIDMLASAGPAEYRKVTQTMLVSDEVDAVIVIYVPVEMVPDTEFVEAICDGVAAARASSEIRRPVAACVMSKTGIRLHLETSSEVIPCFSSPAAAASSLGKVAAYAKWRDSPAGQLPRLDDIDFDAVRRIIAASQGRNADGWLSAEEVYEVGSAIGLPMAPAVFARKGSVAVDAARRVGFPVAIKSVSGQILHKTEIGAVELNLCGEHEVRDAFDRLMARLSRHHKDVSSEGVLVQPMCSGIELMIGASCDPQLGPLLAFGLGGTRVEIVKDLSYRLAPITDGEAADMVRSIRGYRLLTGYRGQPGADVPAIEQLLLRVSECVAELPEIFELDLNPVMALPSPQGCQIVDARIRVQLQ
jgi:acyl-CoA synthetase (NDP forming)